MGNSPLSRFTLLNNNILPINPIIRTWVLLNRRISARKSSNTPPPDETAVFNLATLALPTFIVKLAERDGHCQYETWIGSLVQLGKLYYDLWGVTPT